MLTYYRSDAAKKAAYDSYGGINTRAVYLKPETTITAGEAQQSPTAPDTAGEAQQSPTAPTESGTDTATEPQQPGDDDDDLDKG